MKIYATVAGILLCIPNVIAEQNGVKPAHLYLFHTAGCIYCERIQSFLEGIKPNYPSLVVHEYEVRSDAENMAFLEKMANAYDIEITGVPITFIGGNVIIGFSEENGQQIKEIIQGCITQGCEDAAKRLEEAAPPADSEEKSCGDLTSPESLTMSALMCAAIADAINPCAFAVLTILLATILASAGGLKALMAGLAFALAIFISYFLMGIGIYSAFAASGISHTLYVILAFLALLLGLFNLKDYLGYRDWFVMEIPQAWRPSMKAMLRGVSSVPGAFLVGFAVSLFLLPCSSGPYLVVLGMLAHTTSRNYAMALLALYNFIFVLPMILITLAIYFGLTTAEDAEKWRRSKIDLLHLIAGLLLLALSVAMFVSLYLGRV